jgi:hypothetical protein
MKGERKLRLVAGGKSPAASEEPGHDGASGHEPHPKPPAPAEPVLTVTDAERAAADALRDAIDEGSEPLSASLRAAHGPAPLDPADLDALVARALGDESAATAEERAAAERLRADLEGTEPEGEADLLRALQAAAHPGALPADRNEALLDAALARWRPRARAIRRIPPAVMVALTSVAALAAGVALFLGRPGAAPPSSVALVPARSSEALFDAATPFPRRGEESARVDRIASARAADLRRNRFAAWGVK